MIRLNSLVWQIKLYGASPHVCIFEKCLPKHRLSNDLINAAILTSSLDDDHSCTVMCSPKPLESSHQVLHERLVLLQLTQLECNELYIRKRKSSSSSVIHTFAFGLYGLHLADEIPELSCGELWQKIQLRLPNQLQASSKRHRNLLESGCR